MDKEIFIAFATQKGGIGKTTLTVLTASYLHYVKGYNVAVVDCDAPQNSIADLRGTLKSEGVVKTLSQMDYIFAPISADRLVVESTLQFAALFHENLITTGIAKTKGLYLFWTMVDGRERSELYDLYRQIIDGMNIPMLETRLPDSKRFRRDLSEERKAIFRSTIFPMDNALMRGSNIKELAEEICSVMKIQRV